MDFEGKRLLCNLVFIMTAFVPLAGAECTSGVELLVDGKLWPSSDIPLYKLLGSNGTFVRCQRCSSSGRFHWLNSNDESIPFCDDKMSHLVCVDRVRSGARDVKFLNFTLSQVGNYTCKHSDDKKAIIINGLYLHPTNQLISINMAVKPLNCEATGNGLITYQWETSNINGRRWKNIRNSNSSIFVVGTLEQSQQYRCVVSNEAGSTRSNVVSVTVLKIITHPQSKVIAFNAKVSLMCTSSLLSNVTFSWTRNGTSIDGQLTAGDTSTLTISSVQYDDAGIYVCIVRSGSVSVISNTATVIVYGPPTIMTHPASQLINVSISVTLNCEGIGRGSITYQWESRQNPRGRWMTISNNNSGRLMLKNLERSQQYRCVVSNEAGSTRSNAVTVTVLRFTTQPGNSIIIALTDVMFHCLTSVDGVKYSWYRVNGDLPLGSRGQNSHKLTIVKATPNDQGMYYCMASKENIRVKSMRAILNVNDMFSINISSSIKTLIANKLIADERSTVNFTAVVYSRYKSNFAYQWQKEGKRRLPNKISRFNGSVLVIPHVVESDEGRYYCNVTNEWGRTIISEDVTLSIVVALLIFWRHPVDQIINNSQAATFECFVNGSKSTSVVWEKDGREYRRNRVNDDNNGNSYSLTFNSARVNDGGKYRCNATNGDGYSVVSDEAELIIRPQITINPNSTTVLIGHSAQLLCEALGTNLVYQWMKDDVVVSSADSRILMIDSTDETDEGVYKCVATNTGGMAQSNPATITVYDSPMIEELPQQLYAVLGEQLEITCTATNDQDAPENLMFSWKTPNNVSFSNKTTNEDNISHKATSTLFITTVTRDHGGMYQCIVRNGEPLSANSSKMATVIIEVQSSPPLTFSITQIDFTSFQLTWTEPENPNGRIDYYNVYYSNKSHSLSKQVTNDAYYNGTYTLGNLRPYTEYHVYVTAIRLIGGDASRPLEGVKSRTLTGKTLAGVPVIDHVNTSRIILNSESSTFDDTFTIDLPAITLQHGLFSYLYIIVLTDNAITNTGSISTAMLLEESMKSHPSYYVAAVVNLSQYILGKGLSYILGAGDNTTDIYNEVFYNRKIENGYHYFFRIFSLDSTPENELYITTELQKIEIPQLGGPVESTSNQDNTDNNNASVMAIAVLAVLLAISLICVIVLAILQFKSKMKPHASDKGKSVQATEPTYEMVVKHDDVEMDKNPAYSVQDTSVNHNYDFIPESNQAKAEQ